MTHIFRWSGEYFGFISNGNLFSSSSEYLGWIKKAGSVWKNDGSYLGELVEDNYILRNTSRMKPMASMPKMTPMSLMAPMPPMDRMGRMGRMGWVDALDELETED